MKRLLLALGIVALSAVASVAASYTWNNSSGNWSDSSRWIPNGVPGATDEANINGGEVTVSTDAGVAALNLNGAYLLGNATLTVTNFNNNGGYLLGPCTITVNGVMNWPLGIIDNGVNLNIAAPARLNISGASKELRRGCVINNAGTIIWTGNGGISFRGSTINNLAGGRFEIQNDAGLEGTVNNDGRIRKTLASGQTTFVDPGICLNNTATGVIEVQSGTISLASYHSPTPLINSGAIYLGNGSLVVNGDYLPAASASLNVVLTGPTPVSQFGQLRVTGNAALNGTLDVSLANGFAPGVGDTFLVVNSGARSGSFSSTSGLDLGGGLRLAVSYPPQGTLLTAVTLGITPSTLPQGYAGAAYSQTLSGVNGVPPYSFAVTGGTLPPGLSLSSGGVLSGTPNTAGTFNFAVQVTNDAPSSATANYTMQVLSCTLGGLFENFRAQWRADGNALDARGTSHGTLQNGATFAAGVAGQAFALDGVNAFVEIPDSPGVSITGAISVAAWVRPDSISGNSEILTKYDTSVGSGASRQTSYVVQQHDGILNWNVYLNGNSSRGISTTLPVLGVGVFHHVVCTFDPATQAMAIYVDGVAQPASLDGGSVTVSSIMDSTTPVRLGAIMTSSGVLVNFFSGRIDEVGLFDCALSASEVTTLYNNPSSSCLDTPEFTTVSTLPNGRAGTPYWQAITALLGHTPYSFALTSGALPAGLTLSSAGLISGAPLLSGSSTFTVTVTDALGNTAQREFTISVSPQLPCVTIDGAWARWLGESTTAETINGFNGALFNGATYTPGVVGQAFLFDGVDDYFQASVPYLAVQQPGGSSDKNTTLEFWMRTEAPAPSGASWVAGWGTFNGDSWSVFGIVVDGNQQIGISLGNGFVAPGPVVELGRWYHVAAVFEDGYAKLYVDGSLVGTAAGAFAVNNGPVNIGRFPGGAFNNRLPFKGAVDEPTIFTRALSAAELRSIYDAGASGKCRSLNNTVPNSTCEVIAQTTGDPQIRVRGLAFNPQNEPVVTWSDPGLTDGGVMWTARASGSWGTAHEIRRSGNSGLIPGYHGFALREDGTPFFLYGAQNVDIGNDSLRTGVYLVDGSVEPNGPGERIYFTGEIGSGESVMAFAPGANNPHWVFCGVKAFYDGVPHEHFSHPLWDFVINTNGVPALFINVGGGSIRMSRTFGAIDGPVIANGPRQVAGTVDGNDVFHALMSGATADADWANGKMVYAKSANGTNWVFTDLGPGVDLNRSRAVGLAMNPCGQPAIAYFRAGVLWYAELVNGHWVQTAVGAYSGYAEQQAPHLRNEICRLAFDREGKPAIAVYDPSSQNLMLCRPAPVVQTPVAVCKNITVYLDSSGQATINGADVDGGSHADCGIVRSNVSPNSFTCANLGPNAVTFTIFDDCCQSASCQAIVTVVDAIAPVINAAGSDAIIECPAVPVFTPPTAADNCPHPQVVEVSDVTTTGPCAGAYTRTKTWKAIDASGNESATVSQTITVRDTTAPLLSAMPADMTAECDQVPAPPVITASDLCDANVTVQYAQARVDGNCANNYELKRTWSTTDVCGNSVSHTQTISVQDTTRPVLSDCPSDATVECDAIPAPASVTALDNCDGPLTPVLTESMIPGDNCAADHIVKTITRTWTVRDRCGNEAICSQTITVKDETAPTLTRGSIAACYPTAAAAEAEALAATGANDNCSAVTRSASTVGTCIATVTVTGSDTCNNSASVSYTTRIDNTQPVLSGCPTDAGYQCLADVPAPASVTANDNCDGALTPNYSATTNGTPCDMTITRTWTASDTCGNTASCAQTITVHDTTAPTITVPANATVACDGNTSPAATGTATANDNCGSAAVTYSDILTGNCPGTITRTWTVTDACGNSASQSQIITISSSQADPCPIYGFNGFLPPIDGADATGGDYAEPVRTFKLGSTIPVKFRILCNSSPINDGVHTLRAIFYSAVTTSDVAIDATPTDAATTGNQFRLTGDGQWHFNLSTKAAGFKKGIWKLVATLADGTQHVVWIELKK